MKIPGFYEMTEFELAHFTPDELLWFGVLAQQLPKADRVSPDDATLCRKDYPHG
jgi:hypothetical protein